MPIDPVVPKPRTLDSASPTSEAEQRARNIDAKVPLRGQRVLEVGCGRGQLGSVLRSDYNAEYVGLDIVSYDEWESQRGDGVELVEHDLSAGDSSHLGSFDVIVSLAVLEHVVHPHAMLQAIYRRLNLGGVAYVGANLYRGPIASHWYRQVFFPWPHLLFSDEVWREFYWQEHGRDKTYSWANKLTHAQYLLYFDQIGFAQKRVWRSLARFDKPFYERFSDELSRYPIFDLSYDFIYAILERPLSAVKANTPNASKRELAPGD